MHGRARRSIVRGSDVVTTGDEMAAEARPGEPRAATDRFRSVAQLNMLHSLAAKLNSLGDATRSARPSPRSCARSSTTTAAASTSCSPTAGRCTRSSFRGEMFSDYEKDTVESLITEIGEGITGHVAQTRESLITPDAREVDVRGPDPRHRRRPRIDARRADGRRRPAAGRHHAVDARATAKFDEEDQRLLEVLASHAAVAFQNAKLFQAEREAAETSTALLRLSQTLTQLHSIEDILQEAIDTVPHLVAASGLAAYLRDEETGDFRLLRSRRAGRQRRHRARTDGSRRRPVGRRDAGSSRASPSRSSSRATSSSRRPRRVLAVRRAPRGPGQLRCTGSPTASARS